MSSKSLIPERGTFRDNMDAVADHIKEATEASRNELQVYDCVVLFIFVCSKCLCAGCVRPVYRDVDV